MSNVQETTNHIYFNLVPEGEKGNHRTADASSAITILNNLLQKLAHMSLGQEEESPQQEQLSKHLGNLVNSVENIFEQTDAPPELGKQLLLELLLAVQQVQETQTETTMVSSEIETKGSEAATQNAAEQYQQVLEDVQEQEDEPWWKKAIDIVVKVVVPVVMIAVGLLTAQPELVLAGALVAVMSDTPLMQDLTQGFEDLLTDMGVPESDAEWIAGILTVATVAITTAGVGMVSAVEVGADEAVEAVADVSEKALVDVTEDTTTDLTESLNETTDSLGSSETKKGTKISLNGKKVLKAGLMGGSMAMSGEAPTISEGIFDSIPISNPEMKKALQTLTTVLLELTAVIGLVASGCMSATSEAGSSSAISKGIEKLSKGASELISNNMPELVDFATETKASLSDGKLGKLVEKLADKAPTAERLARGVKHGAAGIAGIAGLVNGGYELEQANIVENMGESQAELTMDMAANKIGENSIKEALDFTKSMNKSLTQIMNSISHFGYVNSAEAQAVASNI
jgi:methyl-accepting chemotaxis protein